MHVFFMYFTAGTQTTSVDDQIEPQCYTIEENPAYTTTRQGMYLKTPIGLRAPSFIYFQQVCMVSHRPFQL